MQDLAASLFEIELRSANPRRHWSPASQSYAPADVLLEYLADGWNLSSVVGRLEHWYGAGRHVDVYYFELARDHLARVMAVHGNPAVHRLVWERQLWVVPLEGDYRLMEEGQAPEVYPLQRAEVSTKVPERVLEGIYRVTEAPLERKCATRKPTTQTA
jgi:hypothetical protein